MLATAGQLYATAHICQPAFFFVVSLPLPSSITLVTQTARRPQVMNPSSANTLKGSACARMRVWFGVCALLLADNLLRTTQLYLSIIFYLQGSSVAAGMGASVHAATWASIVQRRLEAIHPAVSVTNVAENGAGSKRAIGLFPLVVPQVRI